MQSVKSVSPYINVVSHNDTVERKLVEVPNKTKQVLALLLILTNNIIWSKSFHEGLLWLGLLPRKIAEK